MASTTPPSHRPPFLRLPLEMLFTIADHCTPADIVRLMACNRELEDKLRCHLLHIDITRNGASAVPWAAFHGHLNLLKDLQAHGASLTGHWGVPPDRDRRHHSTLDWKVDYGLEYAPDPGRNMRMTFSALHAATVAGHDNVVSWLLDRGAEIDGECKLMCVCDLGRTVQGVWPCVGETGWTALHLAYCYGHDSTAALLLDRGADRHNLSSTYPGVNALHTAIRTGSLAHVKMLLDPNQRFSIDPNAADSRGVKAVATAVRKDQLDKGEYRPRDIVTSWFTSGSQVRRHHVPIDRRQCHTPGTSLWPSVPSVRIKFDPRRRVPSIDLLRLVLQAEVALDAESPAEDGFFYHQLILPLHQALIGGGFAAAHLLLEAGAKPDSPSAGHRPLHCVFSGDVAEYYNTTILTSM
ncbi:ankyrin repeat-containing domain protein [Coniochaeta sp. 2T2.1]|nr:ankyrin repeat-containing domain protein [Coniochaeta sp. 2T2.1]